MKTGIQVSSFRPILTTEEEVKTAFLRMKAMGCDTVQLQWIDPAISVEFVAQMLKNTGIQSVSVQDFYQTILENKDYYYRMNRITGGEWICVSRIPQRLKTSQGLNGYVTELRTMQQELERMGQKLCFHPVSADFAPLDGMDPVEYLLEEMPELMVCADLYHLNKSGKKINDWLRRYAGRICMVHFKDSCTDNSGQEILVPAGQGDTDWTDVVKTCDQIGVAYAFAEQERWQGDPFERLKEAFDWLNGEQKA